MHQIELEIWWDGRIELGIKWDDRVVLGRPIRPIGLVDSGFYELLSDLRPVHVTHWPYFYGSGQLPDGSIRPVPILNVHKCIFTDHILYHYKNAPCIHTHGNTIVHFRYSGYSTPNSKTSK